MTAWRFEISCLQADHSLKHFSQYLHCLGVPCLCVSSCCLQADRCLKHLSQYLHFLGFTLVCVSSCCLQANHSLKHLSQRLHWYGFMLLLRILDVLLHYPSPLIACFPCECWKKERIFQSYFALFWRNPRHQQINTCRKSFSLPG